MLIWWHRLAGQLTAQPVPGLGQHYPMTEVARGKCSRHATAAASNNQHVAGQLHAHLNSISLVVASSD
jgi:hypothetical protein